MESYLQLMLFPTMKNWGRAQYTEIGVAPQLDEGWSVTLNLATFF